MRILITGASGFVGSHLAQLLAREHEVVGVVFRNPLRPACRSVVLDLTDARAVEECLKIYSPQVIVHSAALSKIIECEDSPDLAVATNVSATETLVRGAARLKAKFILLSTDQIYSGDKGRYIESDVPAPVSQYGRTKLASEIIAHSTSDNVLVVRSNSVVGRSRGWGESFSDMVVNRIRRGERLSLYEDQFRSPIHIRAMCNVLQMACLSDVRGVVNVGGPARLSRLETGLAAIRAYGLPPECVEAASYLTHPRSSLMTRDTSYDIGKLEQMMPAIHQRPLEEEFAIDAEDRT